MKSALLTLVSFRAVRGLNRKGAKAAKKAKTFSASVYQHGTWEMSRGGETPPVQDRGGVTMAVRTVGAGRTRGVRPYDWTGGRRSRCKE